MADATVGVGDTALNKTDISAPVRSTEASWEMSLRSVAAGETWDGG